MAGREKENIALKKLSAVLTIGLFAALSGAAQAQLFNPADFASLGSLAGVVGSYTINTDTLMMTGPNSFNVKGVSRNGVAVFDFAGINVPVGANFRAFGSRPVMLLSQGNATFAGRFDLSYDGSINGSRTQPAGAYNTGPGVGGSGYGPGAGGGFGGRGGGSIGGVGVNSYSGGATYGDLSQKLEGGSRGGSTVYVEGPQTFVDAGGYGGGGIGFGASNLLNFSGNVLANGDGVRFIDGDSSSGSGGGILLYGGNVNCTGTLSAQGGRGGSFGSWVVGAGGGGRITVLSRNADAAINSSFFVNGGAGGTSFSSGAVGEPGANGVVTIGRFTNYAATTPAPASLAVFAFGGAMLGVSLLRKRRRN